MAFLVPPGVAAGDLEAALREAGGDLLTRLTLFDAYEGPPLPPGHRNLAYRVALQAADRTLTDADGAAIRDRMAAGHGGFPLVGTPEQVAEGILSLHRAGFGGTTLSFIDYVKEFPYFRDAVLPRLEAAGIR